MSEKAGSTFEVEIVPHRSLGELIERATHMWFQEPAPDPDPAEYEVQIKVRSSGEVVRAECAEAGVAANEIMSEVENDLEALDIEAFREKYGIPNPPRR